MRHRSVSEKNSYALGILDLETSKLLRKVAKERKRGNDAAADHHETMRKLLLKQIASLEEGC